MQSSLLQLCVSSESPLQFAPAFMGSGFEQFLFLVCIPSPQVLEHDDQTFHCVHPPETDIEMDYSGETIHGKLTQNDSDQPVFCKTSNLRVVANLPSVYLNSCVFFSRRLKFAQTQIRAFKIRAIYLRGLKFILK